MFFFVFGLVFGWTVWAGILWGAIWLVDRNNPKNTFLMALVWGLVQMAVLLSSMFMGLLAAATLVLWLVWLMRILMNYYDMTLGPAIIVVALLLAAPFGMQYSLEMLATVNPLLAAIVVLAAPFAIMGAWLYTRLRGKPGDPPRVRAPVAAPPPAVPVARVVSAPKRNEPTSPQRIVPVASAAPEAAPARDPNAPGEPTMLR